MNKNIGTADRIARAIIGIIAIALAFFVGNLYAKIGLAVLGIFSLYESLAGWCALYALLGKNTCPIE